ncbi:hypothetical protein ACP49_09250 [Clostridium botulinum]|uniref:hypothetical protein n=1 Tax=Clostridium botulinum TaxID=1491 RepID=UPI0005F96FD0|nr:hypothetical protein [Clostridium botulinum]KOM97247.1 hypothetical protein ACP53_04140 [Clostridium botulinum]KON00750.1 hypothetical protein ACP49_09250 [Clostridium botulinum]MBY7003525.1 hypothetical protein [Clostridium botulinum]MCR1146001.1 hypothetical protein [Clostridium botulinum]NFH93133.1 hypothetical protein [Clostridium botulinum]
MEEIIKELKDLGYDGKVSKGSKGYSGNMKDYAFIQFPKKGNSSLIKKLIECGWKKEREFKFCSPFETVYSGYSVYISFEKFY